MHRAMRSHQWQIWKVAKGGVFKGERKRSWWFAELYCICGVRKFFVRDSVGRRVTSRYVYPGEYSLTDLGLTQQEISDQLWVLLFERAVADQTVAQFEQLQRERRASGGE
jgi:hypothetical protein